jgi:hypothetical protein
VVENDEQYFKLRVRNYSYLTLQSGVGSIVPEAFIKKPGDGWTTSDGINFY